MFRLSSSFGLLTVLCFALIGCTASSEDETDESAGAATAGGDPAASAEAKLKASLTDYFTGRGPKQTDEMVVHGTNGMTIARVAPADLGIEPDFAVRYYQVQEKNEAFGWGRIEVDGSTFGLVYACEYSRFSKSGSTKIYVFNEAGTSEVLTGSSNRHECFRELADSVKWDSSPSEAPQLPY